MSEKSNNQIKKIVAIFVFVAVTFAIFWSVRNVTKKPEEISQNSLPLVTVSKAEFGPVIRYINAIGTLRPYNSVVIKSEVNAVILKVYFTEGAIVKKGDLLIELDDRGARAALMEAEGYYRKAKSEYDPVDKLANRGVMAKVNRDKLKAEVDVCAAKVESCKAILQKHRIVAPFGGVVGLQEISEGQFVAPGNELVKLVDCNPLKVDFKVTESEIKNVYVGQSVQVLVGGEQSQGVNARIIAIDPESDKISHSFSVRALLDVPAEIMDQYPNLKPGRFVSIKIVPDESINGILIPESSIEKVGDDSYVYRLIEGRASRTFVTTGMRKDGFIEIITGVNEGDIVITSGQQNVLDGRGVSVQTPESLAKLRRDLLEKIEKLKKQREELIKKSKGSDAAQSKKKKKKKKKKISKTEKRVASTELDLKN